MYFLFALMPLFNAVSCYREGEYLAACISSFTAGLLLAVAVWDLSDRPKKDTQ